MHRLQPFKFSYLNTSKRSNLFSLNQLIINQESILHTNMRLSLIFFGLSSVFAIVSSVPLGSIGLEKRQIGGTDIAAAAAPAVATAAVGDITSSSPVAAIFGDIVSSYSSAVAGTGAAAAAAPAAPAAAV